MTQDIICPLCKERNNKLSFPIGQYQLRACEVCDLNFIHPYIQKEEERNPLHINKQLEGEKRSVNFYFHYISQYYKNINSYLDIGCGAGELLRKSQDFDIKIRNGVEEDENRAKHAREYAKCEIFDVDVLKKRGDASYDLISMINVFSHVPDLDALFQNLKSLLNENGKVIIKTGLFKKGFRKNNFFNLQIPEHVHFIGDRTLTYICEKYQFKCIEDIRIPLSDELIDKGFLLSPGLSSFRYTLKKIVYYTPGLSFVLRKLYTRYTKNKLFSNIVVLEK